MIGVFDSGVGGLAVLAEIRPFLPDTNLVYFADNLYLPYGTKTPKLILERTFKACEFLKSQGAQLIVVACNTATAVAVDELRQKLDIPIVAIEPAIKPAVTISQSKSILILATKVTLGSERFKTLLKSYEDRAKFILRPSNDLVEIVEGGGADSVESQQIINDIVQHALDNRVDVVLLGSTHFSYLKGLVEACSSGQIMAIAPSQATAQRAATLYADCAIKKEEGKKEEGRVDVFVTKDCQIFADKIYKFVDLKIDSCSIAYED